MEKNLQQTRQASFNRQSGLIKLIVLIIALVLVLSYFGVNLKKIAESETGRANFGYLMEIINKGWVLLVDWWKQNISVYFADVLNRLGLDNIINKLPFINS